MKLTVVKEVTFDAAHQLPGYDGPCQHIHGHSWKLQVGVSGKPCKEKGMVVDFKDLKTILYSQFIIVLDHRFLNDLHYNDFPHHMPTAENMVQWMVNILLEIIDIGLELEFVRLHESTTSYAEWRKE